MDKDSVFFVVIKTDMSNAKRFALEADALAYVKKQLQQTGDVLFVLKTIKSVKRGEPPIEITDLEKASDLASQPEET